jgi:hypothetical protein
VNLGTYGGQMPSPDGICWHTVTGRNNGHSNVPAGQTRKTPAQTERPQQDSNLRSRLRRAVLYPLSYGGCATSKGTSRDGRTDPSRGSHAIPSRMRFDGPLHT